MRVSLPSGDVRSRFVLEELDRWAGIGLDYSVAAAPGWVTFADGECTRKVAAVRPMSMADASDALSSRFDGAGSGDKDSLSLIFHLLSGAEEIDTGLRDERERFDGKRGVLCMLGLADAPVVDGLAADLLADLRSTWPGLPDLDRHSGIEVTHDVDAPFLYAFSGLRGAARAILSDAKGRDPSLRQLRNWLSGVRGADVDDPYDVFDWLMNQSERRGQISTFYFIAGRSGGRLDGDYDIRSPRMRRLVARVIERGHKIGLHPSYNAFRSQEIIRAEKETLLSVASDAGWAGETVPVRMHYLRFDPVKTPGILDDVGFAFDSTLAFAHRAGFRRGTARDFRLWDWCRERPTSLVERPLVAMDASLYKADYEGLTPSEAEVRLEHLSRQVRAHGGTLTLLWHNNFFSSPRHRVAYEAILDQATGRGSGTGA